MTVFELKVLFERCYRTIRKERRMRERVFPSGDPKREEKLAEMDQLLTDLTVMKDKLKSLMAIPEQAPLFPELTADDYGGRNLGDY